MKIVWTVLFFTLGLGCGLIIDDFAGNTPTDFWFVLEDANGKAWSFSFPEAKFSDIGADTNGLDQEDYKNGSIQAYLDSTEGCTVRVQRWA